MLTTPFWAAALAAIPFPVRPRSRARAASGLAPERQTTTVTIDAVATEIAADTICDEPPAAAPDEAAAAVAEPTETEIPAEPGAPGTLWRDDKGRIRRVPLPPAADQLRSVNAHELVMDILAWIRAEPALRRWYPGGVYGSQEITDLAAYYCAEHDLVELRPEVLRERIATAPGVKRERRRLTATRDPNLAALRERIGRPTEKVPIYTIASADDLAAQVAEAAPKRKRARKVSPPPMLDLMAA